MNIYTIEKATNPLIIEDLKSFDASNHTKTSGNVSVGVYDKGKVMVKSISENGDVYLFGLRAETLDHICHALDMLIDEATNKELED